MRSQFVSTINRLLDTNPKLALVLAEISVGLFDQTGATARHPDRIVNVGIREQLMIGVAAGLAKEGFRPIVHTYAPFLTERPFEQVKLDFSHQGLAGVLVSVGASRDASAAGRTHQAPEDVALIATLPDWTVYVPGHGDEAAILLERAANAGDSIYVRLQDEGNRAAVDLENGEWQVVRNGAPGAPTVIAVGPMLDRTLAAVDQLAAEKSGLTGASSPTIIYTVRPDPVDSGFLRDTVTGLDVIVVEPYLAGTMMTGVTAALGDAPHRYLSVGFPVEEHRHYGTPGEHFAAAGLDPAEIARKIGAFLFYQAISRPV